MTDNLGFAVPELPSARQSCSPDAANFLGPASADDTRFIQGPPTFAVEVRCEIDYGPSADAEMASKRADSFQVGTPVVWDVDPVARCNHLYHAEAQDRATTFAPGQVADAAPAAPGWLVGVDGIFP